MCGSARLSQLDGEGGAAAFLAVDGDAAAVLEDNLSAETEADACAAGLGGEERNEGVLEGVGRHAAAVVADKKSNPRPHSPLHAPPLGECFEAASQRDCSTPPKGERGGGCKLHLRGAALVGILDEIDKHLLQLGAVGIKKSRPSRPSPALP